MKDIKDMKNMEKREYDGLQTTRLTVESPDIMATSKAKLKVKTSSTEEWKEEEVSTPLSTSITTSFD